MTAFIAYLRVSTISQSESGLGLEAQQEAVRRFLKADDVLLGSFVETESGRNCERPQLAAAMEACRRQGARLLIANLSRLARSVRFIASLMESDVKFVAADMPDADPFRLHIEAAINEDEARKVSLRTRAALAAAKARGVKLGGFRGRHLTPAERARGSAAANAERATQARVRALELMHHIDDARDTGAATPSAIARALNARGVTTPAGTRWQAVQIARVLARVA